MKELIKEYGSQLESGIASNGRPLTSEEIEFIEKLLFDYNTGKYTKKA